MNFDCNSEFHVFQGIDTGENGRLGNFTTAYLTVLSNDDPYGKLLFPSQSRDVKIPEDFEPGFQKTTIKNLTVTREQGDWGDIQVRCHRNM